MATYGRSFRLAKKSKNKPGDGAVGPGSHGKYSGEAGFLTYFEICQNLNEKNWYLQYDDVQNVPYAFKEQNWVTFDNPKSIKIKVNQPINTISFYFTFYKLFSLKLDRVFIEERSWRCNVLVS